MHAAMLKKDHDVKWIPVGELKVIWTAAQRTQEQPHIDEIKEGFDPDLVQTLTVTEPNGNGIYHIIDGGHRAEAVRQLWGDEQRLPCTVLLNMDEAGAAKAFRGINRGRRGIHPITDFHVAVTACDAEAVAINNLLTELGYKVGWEPGDIRAVKACYIVCRKYGIDGLREALKLIQDTWGMDVDAVNGCIIKGVALLLDTYREDVNHKRLIERSAKHYTPARLLGTAKSAREIHRGTMPPNIMLVLVENYNHNLRSGRLGEKVVAA